MSVSSPYPAGLVVDYPDRRLNRLTSFFRFLTIIPVLLIWGLLGGKGVHTLGPLVNFTDTLDNLSAGFRTLDSTDQIQVLPMSSETQEIQTKKTALSEEEEKKQFWTAIAINVAKICGILASLILLGVFPLAGLVELPTVLMILFRRKYPKWWFDWNLALTKFGTRVLVYAMLLRDEYPSTDEDQAVHIDVPYPDVPKELSRWLPMVKWLLVVPHYIVLMFLSIASIICTMIAWLSILFTGHYPRSLFEFVVGVLRWSLRVAAYAFILTTDRYPPFRLAN
jgi:hypothetical protein